MHNHTKTEPRCAFQGTKTCQKKRSDVCPFATKHWPWAQETKWMIEQWMACFNKTNNFLFAFGRCPPLLEPSINIMKATIMKVSDTFFHGKTLGAHLLVFGSVYLLHTRWSILIRENWNSICTTCRKWFVTLQLAPPRGLCAASKANEQKVV